MEEQREPMTWDKYKALSDPEKKEFDRQMSDAEFKNIQAGHINETYPSLHAAIMLDDIERFRRLMKLKTDVHEEDHHGYCPIEHIKWSSPFALEIATALLDAGANVNRRGKYHTPLGAAAQSDNVAAVELLIARGAKVNMKLDTADYDTSIALHHAARYSSNSDVVRILLEKGSDPNAKGLLGARPLHDAIKASIGMLTRDGVDKKETVRLLLKFKAAVDGRNGAGETPLMELADSSKDIALVKMLIDAKANVNARDRYKETALHKAAKGGNAPFVELLLKNGADPMVKDSEGHTPRQAMHAFNDAAQAGNKGVELLKSLQNITARTTDDARQFDQVDALLSEAERNYEDVSARVFSAFKRKFGL